MLLAHHVAVWDVIESCDIIGSSDSSIKNVVPADIGEILEKTDISGIYANGKKAESLYRKYIFPKTKVPVIALPSTSPANAACSLEKLVEIWGREIGNAWIAGEGKDVLSDKLRIADRKYGDRLR